MKNMANTYTQMIVQLVFAVQGRQNLIKSNNRDELEKYICGVINNQNCKPLTLYCNPDHIHILLGLHPAKAVSDLVREIKTGSTNFINSKNWIPNKFHWQEGFGAFTYSKKDIDHVAKYILNQAEHHRKRTFQEEYISMLKDFEIEYNSLYLFDWIDLSDLYE
jgi:putative transposase